MPLERKPRSSDDEPVDEPEEPIDKLSEPDREYMADRAADRYLDNWYGSGL